MIDITEQFKAYFNKALEPRLNVATIAERNAIDINERYNGMKTVVRSPEGKEYQLLYSGNFEALSTAAKNAFLADNNNWKEVVSNASLDLKEDKANKGVANGYTPLGSDTKIPLQFIPDSVLGALEYKGVWSATTNTAPHGSPENGWYYKVNVAGQTTFTGSTVDWAIGDWIIYNGTTWDRVANADKVISVNGDEGEVIIDDSNLEHEPSVSIPTWISSVYTAGVATMRAVFDAVITRIGTMDTQLTDIEDKLDTIEEGANNYSPPDYFGDVEILETGQTIIQQGVVTNQKMSTMPAGTFKAAKVAGYPGNVTAADVKVMLSLPADTASDLSAAQSAILALQTLVASDNFNLDTVQEIVDFIEANRDDLNTYVADLNNKVDKEVGKSLISIDEIARLLTMETNAKDDQTATEIRDLLITLTGTNRLPASAIKDIPQTTIVDNLTTQSAVQALSANQGYVINQNLIAKQAAIDSLIQLVASDNFNLDTVQEIVDFIEQNRTDLDTYVSDLAGKLDSVQNGNGITVDITDPNNPKVELAENAYLERDIQFDATDFWFRLDVGNFIRFHAGQQRVSVDMLNQNQFKVDINSTLIQRLVSGNKAFSEFVENGTGGLFEASLGATEDGTTFKIIANKNGAYLIGTQTDASNAIATQGWVTANAGGGGEPTPVVNNLTSDSTTSALAAAQGKALKGLIDKQFYLGYQRETQGNYVTDTEYTIELAFNGYKQDVWKILPQTGENALYTISIDSANNDVFQPWSGYVLISGLEGVSDINTFRLPIGWDFQNEYKDVVIPATTQALYKFTRMSAAIYWEFIGDNSEIGGKYPDETEIGTAITASRTFALTDLGSKKVTAVNSGSAVVLTIPADATLNMPIGSTINLRRRGAGTVEIVGASGVTVEGIQDTNGDYKIVRYGIVSAYKEAANLWVVYGALEP